MPPVSRCGRGLALGLVGLVVGMGGPVSARTKTATTSRMSAVERLQQRGVVVTAGERECITGRSGAKGAAAPHPVDGVLACLPQRVLIDQIIRSTITTGNASLRACLVDALEGTPWVALADLYRAFDHGTETFVGRFDPFRRVCEGRTPGASVEPSLVLDDFTDRWNEAVAERPGSDLRLVATWVSTGPGTVSAGRVSPTMSLGAFFDAPSPAPSGADNAVPATSVPPPRLSAVLLTVRPVPDLKGATIAVSLLAETIDASGRSSSAVRGLRLADVLGSASPTVTVRVAGILYTASIFRAAAQPDALQLTAFTSHAGGS